MNIKKYILCIMISLALIFIPEFFWRPLTGLVVYLLSINSNLIIANFHDLGWFSYVIFITQAIGLSVIILCIIGRLRKDKSLLDSLAKFLPLIFTFFILFLVISVITFLISMQNIGF